MRRNTINRLLSLILTIMLIVSNVNVETFAESIEGAGMSTSLPGSQGETDGLGGHAGYQACLMYYAIGPKDLDQDWSISINKEANRRFNRDFSELTNEERNLVGLTVWANTGNIIRGYVGITDPSGSDGFLQLVDGNFWILGTNYQKGNRITKNFITFEETLALNTNTIKALMDAKNKAEIDNILTNEYKWGELNYNTVVLNSCVMRAQRGELNVFKTLTTQTLDKFKRDFPDYEISFEKYDRAFKVVMMNAICDFYTDVRSTNKIRALETLEKAKQSLFEDKPLLLYFNISKFNKFSINVNTSSLKDGDGIKDFAKPGAQQVTYMISLIDYWDMLFNNKATENKSYSQYFKDGVLDNSGVLSYGPRDILWKMFNDANGKNQFFYHYFGNSNMFPYIRYNMIVNRAIWVYPVSGNIFDGVSSVKGPKVGGHKYADSFIKLPDRFRGTAGAEKHLLALNTSKGLVRIYPDVVEFLTFANGPLDVNTKGTFNVIITDPIKQVQLKQANQTQSHTLTSKGEIRPTPIVDDKTKTPFTNFKNLIKKKAANVNSFKVNYSVKYKKTNGGAVIGETVIYTGSKQFNTKDELYNFVKNPATVLLGFDYTETQTLTTGQVYKVDTDGEVFITDASFNHTIATAFNKPSRQTQTIFEYKKLKDDSASWVPNKQAQDPPIVWQYDPDLAFAEIKHKEPEKEHFEAMAGVPSDEDVFFSVGGTPYLARIESEMVSGKAQRNYLFHWKGVKSEHAGTGTGTTFGNDAPRSTTGDIPNKISLTHDSKTNTWDPYIGSTFKDSQILSGELKGVYTPGINKNTVTCVGDGNTATGYSGSSPTQEEYNNAKAEYDKVLEKANKAKEFYEKYPVAFKAKSDGKLRLTRFEVTIDAKEPPTPDSLFTDGTEPQCANTTTDADGNILSHGFAKDGREPSVKEGSWSVSITVKLPEKQIHGPDADRMLPDLWARTVTEIPYKTRKINSVQIYEIKNGELENVNHFLDANKITASVVRGENHIWYNIRPNENDPLTASKEGRIFYNYHWDGFDTPVIEMGSRTPESDGMNRKRSSASNVDGNPIGSGHNDECKGAVFEPSNEPFTFRADDFFEKTYASTFWENADNAKNQDSPEYKALVREKDKLCQASIVSDYVILQTAEGDRALLYFDQNEAGTDFKIRKQKRTATNATDDSTWHKNPLAAPKQIDVGLVNNPYLSSGYMGNFKDANRKYTLGNTSDKLSTRWDYNSGGANRPALAKIGTGAEYSDHGTYRSPARIERPKRNNNHMIISGKAHIPMRTINGEKEVNGAKVLYDKVLDYGNGPVDWKVPKKEKHGIYSRLHDEINNIVVHSPVSVRGARIVPEDKRLDQRTKGTIIGDLKAGLKDLVIEQKVLKHNHPQQNFAINDPTMYQDEGGGRKSITIQIMPGKPYVINTKQITQPIYVKYVNRNGVVIGDESDYQKFANQNTTNDLIPIKGAEYVKVFFYNVDALNWDLRFRDAGSTSTFVNKFRVLKGQEKEFDVYEYLETGETKKILNENSSNFNLDKFVSEKHLSELKIGKKYIYIPNRVTALSYFSLDSDPAEDYDYYLGYAKRATYSESPGLIGSIPRKPFTLLSDASNVIKPYPENKEIGMFYEVKSPPFNGVLGKDYFLVFKVSGKNNNSYNRFGASTIYFPGDYTIMPGRVHYKGDGSTPYEEVYNYDTAYRRTYPPSGINYHAHAYFWGKPGFKIKHEFSPAAKFKGVWAEGHLVLTEDYYNKLKYEIVSTRRVTPKNSKYKLANFQIKEFSLDANGQWQNGIVKQINNYPNNHTIGWGFLNSIERYIDIDLKNIKNMTIIEKDPDITWSTALVNQKTGDIVKYYTRRTLVAITPEQLANPDIVLRVLVEESTDALSIYNIKYKSDLTGNNWIDLFSNYKANFNTNTILDFKPVETVAPPDDWYEIKKRELKVGEPIVHNGQTQPQGDFILLDREFSVIIPNWGNFLDTEEMGIPETTVRKGAGYVDDMDCTHWTRSKQVRFSYDVIYKGRAFNAGEWIDVAGEGSIGNVPITQEEFKFYTPLNNEEWRATGVEFRCVAKNVPPGQETTPIEIMPENFVRDDINKAANHDANKEVRIDVVGRIGNVKILDAGDPRFSSLFKERLTDWDFPDKVDRVLESKQFKYFGNTNDIHAREVGNEVPGMDTNINIQMAQLGETEKHCPLPMQPKYNPVPALQNQILRLGYPVFAEIETRGNYLDTLQIIPKYYAIDTLRPNNLQPVDLYFSTNAGDLVLGNKFGLFDDPNINGVPTTISDEFKAKFEYKPERIRRLIFDPADMSELTRDPGVKLHKSIFGDALPTLEDKVVLNGNLQLMTLKGNNRTLVGSENTYGVNRNPAPGFNRTVGFYTHGQRWFFTWQVPTSTKIVRQGEPPTEENIRKVMNNHTAILVTLEFRARGQVYNLATNGSNGAKGTLELGGKIIPLEGKVGEKETPFVIITTHRTAKDDLDTFGTH